MAISTRGNALITHYLTPFHTILTRNSSSSADQDDASLAGRPSSAVGNSDAKFSSDLTSTSAEAAFLLKVDFMFGNP